MPSTIGNVTLQMATSTEAYPIRRMVKEQGEGVAAIWISDVLTEADLMCGGKNPPHILAAMGRMMLHNYAHRSVESLVMAIRDGLNRKVYGQLTYPQIAEWMSDHEAAIMGAVESEAARHRFTGDNLGSDYLDRQEHDHNADKRKIARMGSHIEALKAKLSNDDNA